MLTEPRDLVIDIFAGSNTTGMVAEQEGRRWMAFDERRDFLAASAFRFLPEETMSEEARVVYDSIIGGESVQIKTALQEALEL